MFVLNDAVNPEKMDSTAKIFNWIFYLQKQIPAKVNKNSDPWKYIFGHWQNQLSAKISFFKVIKSNEVTQLFCG